MMINALFNLGTLEEKYTQRALSSLQKLLDTIYIDNTLYHTTLIHKTPKVEAFLEDYAYLSQALLSAYKFTQNEVYIIQAQRFVNTALERYYKNGLWKFSEGEFETKAETTDNTYTSSVSIMVDVLLTLSSLLEDEKYSHFAFKTLEYNSYELGRRPVYYPYMLDQMLRYLKGNRILKSDTLNIKENLSKLNTLNYPYTLFVNNGEKDFMVCGDKSCFANTNELEKLDSIITNSF